MPDGPDISRAEHDVISRAEHDVISRAEHDSAWPAEQHTRARLNEIDAAPLEQHVEVYEDVHSRLQEGLADLDDE